MNPTQKLSRCDNCHAEFIDFATVYKEFVTVSGQVERSIPATNAISTVFEGVLSDKQKTIPPNTDIEMCFQCISILAELFRFYTEFLELSHEASYIRSLIEESVVWKSNESNNSCKPIKEELRDPFDLELETNDNLNDDEYHSDSTDEDVKYFYSEKGSPQHIHPPPVTRITRSRTEQEGNVFLELQWNETDQSSSSLSVRRINRKSKSRKKAESDSSTKRKPKSKKKYESSETNSYKCQECPETFKNQLKLESHCKTTSHSIELKCPECDSDEVFKSFQILRAHIRKTHKAGSAEDKKTCAICSKVFTDSYKLKLHNSTVHAETKEFKCTKCSKEFSTKRYLQEHLRCSHSVLKTRFPCPHCELAFASRPGLRRHFKDKHMEESQKPYISCEECGKKFLRPEHYRLHMKIHDTGRSKSVSCPACDKAFYSAKLLRSHLKTHDGQKEELCTFCGVTFLTAGALKRHVMVKHADDKLNSGHTCHICGKTFKRKDYLLQHLRSKSHGGDGHISSVKDKLACNETSE